MLSIEKARQSDIDFVKQLETESGLSVWTWQDYLEEVDRQDSIFLIVKEEEENRGFLLARLIMNQLNIPLNPDQNFLNNTQPSEIDIYNIAVEKKSRGKSFGAALLNRLIQIGIARNACKINLEVRKSNANALNFYKKNLFEAVGLRKNFYSNPTEDAVLMTRRLA